MSRPSIGRSANARFVRTLLDPEPGEAEAFLARAAQQPSATVPGVEDLHAERAREAASDSDEDGIDWQTVPGTGGPVRVRVSPVDDARAVVVNAHASGWTRGRASWTDVVARVLQREHGVITVAPEYRLAPEHPHPAGLDDIVDVLVHVIESFSPAHGDIRVFVLGSSAGAHLSALALLRLRDQRPTLFDAIRGAVLSYGIYDLSRAPSMRLAPPDTPVVSPVPQAQYMDWAFPGTGDEDRRDPSLSALYADLHGMPPALFSACERDPLRDDTLFMAARWADAGCDADLDIWTDCVHSFERHYPVTGRRYAERVGRWIDAQ